jgi:hypothetical protein
MYNKLLSFSLSVVFGAHKFNWTLWKSVTVELGYDEHLVVNKKIFKVKLIILGLKLTRL